jgi:predicted O-methyltransferase YrrM
MEISPNPQFLLDVEFITPTESENEVLKQLKDSYTKVSEMIPEERAFLNALVIRKQPKKLLEVGVAAGGSSIVILNAIKDIADAKLYSIDLNEKLYTNPNFKTGCFVDNYQSLKLKWELFTGDLAHKFMDKVGADIDFCLIDTAHVNPGEMFDFLMVLPFLDDNAIVVFHDVAYHTFYSSRRTNDGLVKAAITTDLLMSSITGRKILLENYQRGETYFPNIAGIRINANTKENVFEIFNLLKIKWYYLPTDDQEKEMISFFEKYYNKYYIDYLVNVFQYQKIIRSMDIRQAVLQSLKD